MSHNKITVNGQASNSVGAITQALGDLSDTSGTPTDQQILMNSGGAWAPQTPALNAVLTASHIAGEGTYAVSSVYSPSLEGGWFFSVRTVTGNGPCVALTQDIDYAIGRYRVFTATAQYFDHIELAAGYVYQLYMEYCIGGNSDAGASIEVQWQDDAGNALGPRAFIRQKGENRVPIRGVIDLTSASGSTDVGLQRVGSGVNGNARYALEADDVAQFNLSVRILT